MNILGHTVRKKDCTESSKTVPELALVLKAVQNLDLEPKTNWEATDLVSGEDSTDSTMLFSHPQHAERKIGVLVKWEREGTSPSAAAAAHAPCEMLHVCEDLDSEEPAHNSHN